MWSRIHLIPLLQAEEDRDLVRRHLASQAMEKELLGAETKVYNSDRCVLFRLWGRNSRQRTHRSLLTRAAQICATNLCCHSEQCNQINKLRGKRWCIYTMTALRRSEREESTGRMPRFEVIAILLDHAHTVVLEASFPIHIHRTPCGDEQSAHCPA